MRILVPDRRRWGRGSLCILIAAALCAIILTAPERKTPAASLSADTDAPVLIIDAGHGGEDGGAVAPDGMKESGVNLDIALRLNDLAGFFGVRRVMTRRSEELDYPTSAATTSARKKWDTRQRVALINSVDNGVLLSIHQNNYPGGGPRGPQVFYGTADGSEAFAALAHANLAACLYPEGRRVAAPCAKNVYIMAHASCPAILAECGFLSNTQESALLASGVYRAKIAVILLASYLQYTGGGL